MNPHLPEDRLRQLPSVDRILRDQRLSDLVSGGASRWRVTESARAVLSEARSRLLAERDPPPVTLDDIISQIRERLRLSRGFSLKPVINATGVILHTGLGRAPLAAEALERLAETCRGYSNLEVNLENGERSSRQEHVRGLLRDLTGAEDALVVNNNAGALLLAVNTIAAGSEVIVSRGELVEIGDSFRLPEIIQAGGARLVEVGTTNRTYLSDYERALTSATRLILKVHPSNFRIVGFTQSTDLKELVRLAADSGIPLLHDLGSGALIDSRKYCPSEEPVVRKSVEDGASLAIFSADKLLGGPQGGIIVGCTHLIDRLKRNPIYRALRVGKLSLAALEWTLRQYLDGTFEETLPVWQMISAETPELERRASALCRSLEEVLKASGAAEVADDNSEVGGGALPGTELPTKVVSVRVFGVDPAVVAGFLRRWDPPVFTRTKKDRLLLDVRTIDPSQFEFIVAAFDSFVSGRLQGESKESGPG